MMFKDEDEWMDVTSMRDGGDVAWKNKKQKTSPLRIKMEGILHWSPPAFCEVQRGKL